MKAFVELGTGRLLRLVRDEDVDLEPVRENAEVRDWPDGVDPEGLFWPSTEAAPVPDTARQLSIAKAEAQARVKSLREAHTDKGILVPGVGLLETDLKSRLNISGSVQLASLGGESFSTVWRTADNQYVDLDAVAMVQMGVLVAEHVAACQYRKNELDAEIDAAATLADLNDIDLEAGWPGS